MAEQTGAYRAACETCAGSEVVAQEGQIGVPGSGCHLTCPDCGPTPSEVVDPDDLSASGDSVEVSRG